MLANFLFQSDSPAHIEIAAAVGLMPRRTICAARSAGSNMPLFHRAFGEHRVAL